MALWRDDLDELVKNATIISDLSTMHKMGTIMVNLKSQIESDNEMDKINQLVTVNLV
ncbi:GatB/YqeY domain-containing protein [Candidatus Enterovibrio escicola]|uniref:GatB/YqeY domain-containing protein n=1 Tax=Candidatus Enterovibrio escicola TaxID=1927127 RepID=UPI00168023FB|nr:GatB/YqeY domain-containing protein [Candidatus Enterovibrio escacola]